MAQKQARANEAHERMKNTWKVGDRVFHSRWGAGVVVDSSESRDLASNERERSKNPWLKIETANGCVSSVQSNLLADRWESDRHAN